MKKNKAQRQDKYKLWLVKPLGLFYAYFFLGYRRKNKYKIKNDEPVVVISNHQTDYDPILVHLSFNHLLHTLATDNIFKGRFMYKFLTWLKAIPKKKGVVDLNSNLKMMRDLKNGSSLLFFPE